MTTLLSVETSTPVCSVALLHKNTLVVREEKTHQSHGQTILSLIDQLLFQTQIPLFALDAIVFGRGPGAFTGLRIGIAVVQGLAFGLSCRVVSISSLQALAQAAFVKTGFSHILTAQDARMGEIYFGAFIAKEGVMLPCLEETVIKPDRVSVPSGHTEWLAVGSGFDQYFGGALHFIWKDATIQRAEHFYPTAGSVAQLGLLAYKTGATADPSCALPIYLRGAVPKLGSVSDLTYKQMSISKLFFRGRP